MVKRPRGEAPERESSLEAGIFDGVDALSWFGQNGVDAADLHANGGGKALRRIGDRKVEIDFGGLLLAQDTF